MHGTVNMGEEVMTVIKTYLRNKFVGGRRSNLIDPKETDTISFIVKSSFLCQGIEFCEGQENFVNELIIVLADSLENILSKYTKKKNGDAATNSEDHKVSMVAKKLKEAMVFIKIELISANRKITEETNSHYWIDLIKKISGKLQDIYLSHLLETNKDIKPNYNREILHNVITTTVNIEVKYQAKLCTEFNICIKSYECTSALERLLIHFEDLTEEKARDFVSSFNEVLFDTTFYSKLSETTASKFESLLHEITNSPNVSVKDTLLNLQIIIGDLMKDNYFKKYKDRTIDVQLVRVILSDMDHFYDDGKSYPFFNFFEGFYKWIKTGERLNKVIKVTLKEISKKLSNVEDQLFKKLMTEVEVFLDIVLDLRISL